MKRLLALVLLAGLQSLASAAPITVAVQYTPAVAAQAGGDAAFVNQVSSLISAANAAYSASGINVTLTAVTTQALRPGPDSAPVEQQLSWVKNSPDSWLGRANAGADITILVTMVQNQFAPITPGVYPVTPPNSVAVVPYGVINTQMEVAISRIMGATSGYRSRVRSYPTDPVLQGANFCYHTRESIPSDPNQVVPFLPFWRAYPPGNQFYPNGMTTSDSGNANDACRAYYNYMNSTYGPPNYVGWNVSGGNLCNVTDNQGHVTANAPISYNSNPGSSTVSCQSEFGSSYYAKNGNMPTSPYLSLGGGAVDSVTPMNANAPAISNWHGRNYNLLANVKALPENGVLTGFLYRHWH